MSRPVESAPALTATRQELAANISAFNIANAIGGIVGGSVVDSQYGAAVVPFAAAAVPFLGLLFILNEERKRRMSPEVAPVAR